ncbi:MAG: hypothetical protein U0836_17705 [Pirellulales bacterium]
MRLERDAFAYRDQIQAGQVDLHSVVSTRFPNEATPRKLDRRKVWFLDSGQMRADEEESYFRKPSLPGGSKYWVRNSLTADEHLYCTEDASREVMPYGASRRHPKLVTDPLDAGVTDLRWLGVSPLSSSNLKQFPPRPFLDRPDIEVTDVKDETFDGVACVRIAFRRRDGAEGVIRIAPDRGPSLVGFSIRDGELEEEVRSRIEKHKPSGYWFPTEFRYLRRDSGKVHTDEKATIKIQSLGQPLPPETFMFAGMGLPAGSEVASMGFEGATNLVWTGKELLPGYPVESGGGSSPWWLWLAGVSAVLIGVVLVVRSLARR